MAIQRSASESVSCQAGIAVPAMPCVSHQSRDTVDMQKSQHRATHHQEQHDDERSIGKALDKFPEETPGGIELLPDGVPGEQSATKCMAFSKACIEIKA